MKIETKLYTTYYKHAARPLDPTLTEIDEKGLVTEYSLRSLNDKAISINNTYHSHTKSSHFIKEGNYKIVICNELSEFQDVNTKGYELFYESEGYTKVLQAEGFMREFIEDSYCLPNKDKKLSFFSSYFADLSKYYYLKLYKEIEV